MKVFVAVFLLGQIGTFLILKSASEAPKSTAKERKISYEEVNDSAFKEAMTLIGEYKGQTSQVQTENMTTVEGKSAFSEKMANLFTYLKQNQVLFRYEINNSLKTYLNDMDSVRAENVERFNQNINQALDIHKNTILQLRFNALIKEQAAALIEGLKNPLTLKVVKKEIGSNQGMGELLPKLENSLNNMKMTKEVVMHAREAAQGPSPVAPILGLWTVVSVFAFLALKKSEAPADKPAASEAEEQINPTFKRIMSDLDYPMLLVDQGLNIIWQNKKSESLGFETKTIQNIFQSTSQGNEEILLDGHYFAIDISELAYKSGKKNFLAQLKPKVTSNRYLEHLVDTSEITSLLESQTSNGSFGDVNQSVAQLSVKLGYLFKVSGKFLDLHFKKEISDCFIEADRLEGMLKEFIMGCHHIVKDDSEVQGLFLRTDEAGNKFSVSCFLMNFRKDGLDNHSMTKEFLRRFSILEAKYSICNPSIDFKFKTAGDVKGLDITLNFDNRSELETLIGSVAANA